MKLRYIDSVNKKAVDLQSSRIARVVQEPGLTNPHVYIAVRHPTLGTRRIRFCHLLCTQCILTYIVSKTTQL